MKYLLSLACLSLFSSTFFGQNTKLPAVLQPDGYSLSEAKRMGVEVFKILPRGTYENPKDSYKDDDNPIGIRQGGAYYSFSTHSHSYNQTPQLGLDDGKLLTGFAGLDYGLLSDLGSVSLSDIGPQSSELKSFLTYQPPQLVSEIRNEQKKYLEYHMLLPALVGHTYILRAISYDKADTLVAFNVFSKGDDGSLTVIWKPIREFEKPVHIYQPDADLRASIDKILEDNGLAEVQIDVKNNIVILSGTIPRGARGNIYRLLHDQKTKGFDDSMIEK